MVADDLSGLSASTLDDLMILTKALHEIVQEAVEGEIVRTAMIALQNTESGRRYLENHPIIQ